MDDVYENIDKYSPNDICEVLIVLDDKISDMLIVDSGYTCCTHKKIKEVLIFT